MTIRKIAAAAIAASLMLGTAGCTFMSPIASQMDYAPSDGVQVALESVKLRNFIYLSDGAGRAGLFGSLVNTSLESTTVQIQYTDAVSGDKSAATFNLLPQQKLDLGYGGTTALAINLEAEPGRVAEIFAIQTGGVGKALNVPVLDGTLAEYKALVSKLPAAQVAVEESSN